MTRNPERIDRVLEQLEEYWKNHPHLKLSTIMENIRSQRIRDGEMNKRNRIGDLKDKHVQAYLEWRNEENRKSDYRETEKEILRDLVGLYEDVLDGLKLNLEEVGNDDDGFKFGEDREDDYTNSPKFKDLFEKAVGGDWRKNLSCPECGHGDYEIDGWCIKCPECGHRSRSDKNW